jgi:hypothetical protein
MASNLVHSALATHTQVFLVLTSAQINRIRPFASLRHAVLGERASPQCHAVDLPRRWAWIVVPVSHVIRSASFAVSRFRRHQLKASVALAILSRIRLRIGE